MKKSFISKVFFAGREEKINQAEGEAPPSASPGTPRAPGERTKGGGGSRPSTGSGFFSIPFLIRLKAGLQLLPASLTFQRQADQLVEQFAVAHSAGLP